MLTILLVKIGNGIGNLSIKVIVHRGRTKISLVCRGQVRLQSSDKLTEQDEIFLVEGSCKVSFGEDSVSID